jgi:ferrous iron transport protein A
MHTLKNVKPGDRVEVRKINGQGALKRRIMDMGITRGTAIYVRKVAPLGDPVEITVRGYELALRKSDAEVIDVEDIAVVELETEVTTEA